MLTGLLILSGYGNGGDDMCVGVSAVAMVRLKLPLWLRLMLVFC